MVDGGQDDMDNREPILPAFLRQIREARTEDEAVQVSMCAGEARDRGLITREELRDVRDFLRSWRDLRSVAAHTGIAFRIET